MSDRDARRSSGGRPIDSDILRSVFAPAGGEVPFQRPSLPSAAKIERYFDLSREAHWFSNGGPCWRLFSDRLADRAGAFCVPVASGTLGLMVAIAAVLEAGPGHENQGAKALMPSFTFIATAQAAMWCGLRPALVDIAPDHWHIDPARLESVLRGRSDVGVTVGVSAFGTPAPVDVRDRWERACRAAEVPLVVDSAAGFGAMAEDGVAIGRQGDLEVVSFHATKPFAIGEGGAVFTRSRGLYERVLRIVNFGLRRDRTLTSTYGTNAKMSELHAATGLAVLDDIDSIIDRRRQAAAVARARARKSVAWQAGCERSTWQFLPVAFSGSVERSSVEADLRGRVETRHYYAPLHQLDSRRWNESDSSLPETDDLCSRVLCLPMANELRDGELNAIIRPLQ